MDDVFLGLGSNVGDRLRFLADAVRALKMAPSLHVVKLSGIYRTEPVGVKEQPEFLNTVLRIETSQDVHSLHAFVKTIEKELGRRESARWGPREIDIDILMCGNLILNEPNLMVPHPEMNRRRFVLQPLAEIAPRTEHPVARKSVAALLEACGDTNVVERSEDLTQMYFSLLEESSAGSPR